ncbi:hypothetical protein SAMN05444007_108222 [Cribrihabitans marinus]|uniref:Transcriptional regulator, AlpA family n=1 Tax=Cribrihabitans marinus TaxID=1227549 RepID=A0A1H7CRA2_9RHOB|nr:hypothetical protein [Cribrihabitans marinus]GGH36117.1 hypothetical protein GCM10010973_29900 [Cribrihabitans marinus]SEJ91087.1 hypothetical protein SAMN05444007_108222 [Cribrihabitans marinus]
MTFITADAVAEMVGFETAAGFLAARRRLERQEDFPPPMPTCQRPLKWRTDAVQAWLDTAGIANPAAPTPIGANVVLLEEARKA